MKTTRNFELAEKVGRLSHDAPINAEEIAAFLGVSLKSIHTQRVHLPPRLVCGGRKLMWRFGDVLQFLKQRETAVIPVRRNNAKGQPQRSPTEVGVLAQPGQTAVVVNPATKRVEEKHGRPSRPL